MNSIVHSNSHSSMIHSFTGYSVICARANSQVKKKRKQAQKVGAYYFENEKKWRKNVNGNEETNKSTDRAEDKSGGGCSKLTKPRIFDLASERKRIVLLPSCREKKKDKRESRESCWRESVTSIKCVFPEKLRRKICRIIIIQNKRIKIQTRNRRSQEFETTPKTLSNRLRKLLVIHRSSYCSTNACPPPTTSYYTTRGAVVHSFLWSLWSYK